MSWNDGYRTDIAYTHGYYSEINPAWMRFLLLMAGIAPPEVRTCCELGYGQGISLNIHAAAENSEWWGTDFNPAQAAFANEMSVLSGAHCLADSFQALGERADLPEFDYIALHGIWSWISAENQQAIINFIDKKLRPGGVLYISYNTNPGWAPFRPLRDLMKLYVERHEGSGAAILGRIGRGMAFAEQLADLSAAYFKANPSVPERLKFFKDRDAAYLAHELFNDDWSPSNFADMAKILSEARLSFACAATPLALIPGIGLTKEQRSLLEGLNDPVLREATRDFVVNQQFRKDYWIKGARLMSQIERDSALRKEQFILLTPVTNLKRKIKINKGDITLSEAAHAVFTNVLGDGKVHSGAELEKATRELAQRPDAPAGVEKENLFMLMQALLVLMREGIVAPAQKKISERTLACSAKLNVFFEQKAMASNEIKFLASPVTGGGVEVGRIYQLFLLAIKKGAKTPQEMAIFARDCLAAVGQSLLLNGQPLQNAEAAINQLLKMAQDFTGQYLPVLKNLQVA